jgi:hypothetical protein
VARGWFSEQFRCTATSKQSGERCKRRAHPGTNVCVSHGAGSPAVRSAAARRREQARLDGELGALLRELEAEAGQLHPAVVLLEQVARCYAMVEVLGDMVGGLAMSGPGQVPAGSETVYGRDHLGDARPHVLVTLYETWVDRAARTSKLALDAGVDERRVRLSEDQGRIVAGTVRTIVTSLGHDLADPRVETIVRGALAAASSEASAAA